MSQARVRIESSVNLGPWGNPDPYFVSFDLSTARHPQILLATHLNGKPLTVEHGASLGCTVKLGLKNIKANYADYLYEGRTAGLLGKARVFTLRRNSTPF
ncbi:MAG: molybdopterin-dependent oxidoreductase [Terriglobales bacterium]